MFELLVNPVHEPSEALILHVAANIAQDILSEANKIGIAKRTTTVEECLLLFF
jgi:hypothetical protein